jgi:peptidoglycan/LPS O-acetylase OafA/YrhL
VTTTAEAPTRVRPRFGHIPALDGLRGVAVLGVLLYHGDHLQGGFLGVDLFFVLSGFLITSLLVAEWDADGRIDLRRFWSRRFRRLLPASLLLLVAVCGMAAVTMTPLELGRFRGDALAAVADVANWRAISTGSDYWAGTGSPSPLRHMWSLSVEEQLYVAWPLVVAGALLLGRRRGWGRQSLLVTATVATAASIVAMVSWGIRGDETRAYYGTDTRASAVLLGALAAILLSGRGAAVPTGIARALSAMVPVAMGILAAAWIWADGTDSWLYLWGFPVLSGAAAVVVASVAAGVHGAPRATLSVAPLRWLGRISYGVYLWHWPIYVVVDEDVVADRWPRTLARVALTLVLAEVSYRCLEQPVRTGRVGTTVWRVAAPLGIAAVVVGALAATTDAEQPPRSGEFVQGGTGPLSMLLLGDSQAYSLGVGHRAFLDEVALSELAYFGCGVGPGLAKAEDYTLAQDGNGVPCPEVAGRMTAAVQEQRPDVVVLHVGAFDIMDREVDGVRVDFGSSRWDQLTRDGLRDLLAGFHVGTTRVVALATPCYRPRVMGDEPLPRAAVESIVRVRDQPERITRFNELLREAASEAGAEVLPFDELFCEGDEDDQPARLDGVHLTPDGAEVAFGWILEELAASEAP